MLFCLKLFELQMSEGAYFLFEQPAHNDTWKVPEVVEFLASAGMGTSIGDQCMYELTTRWPPGKPDMPAKKPTQFAGNLRAILQELSTGCDGGHAHQQLIGGRAPRAQEYTDKLCEAMCKGLTN